MDRLAMGLVSSYVLLRGLGIKLQIPLEGRKAVENEHRTDGGLITAGICGLVGSLV